MLHEVGRVFGCGRRRVQGNDDLEREGYQVAGLEDLISKVLQRLRADGHVADWAVAKVDAEEVARSPVLRREAGHGLHHRLPVEGRFRTAAVYAAWHRFRDAWQRTSSSWFASVQF